VVRATGWVGVHALAEEGQVLQLVPVEIARNVDALTAHNYNLPAQKHLFGHDGRQAAEEMASAIEHQDLPLRHLRQPPGKATYHTMPLFKVCNSVVFRRFTQLCNHHCSLENILITPRAKPE